MKITELIWFDDIIEKLGSKHNVKQDEVEEVLASHPQFRFVEKGIVLTRMYTQLLGKLMPAGI